jgi:toxin YoeB
MEILFTQEALADVEFWKKSGNAGAMKRIQALLKSIQETPFSGIGKPELLKYDLSGSWSRRITQEHRLTYIVKDNQVIITGLRFHY